MRNLTAKQIPAYDESREREFFIYNAPFNKLVIGTEQITQIEIAGDADFEIRKISSSYIANLAAPTILSSVAVPIIDFKIENVTNGESYFTDFDFSEIFSNAIYPFVLPSPQAINARSVLKCTLKIGSGFNIDFLNIAFIGARVYR